MEVSEKTFSSYNKQQGQAYSEVRRDYSPELYRYIIDKHTSTGGQLETVLDIGCGPGLATKTLALHFKQAIGLDPSDGMIDTARARELKTSTGELVRFEVASAESLGAQLHPPVADASIDLITAANAAHWFDMPKFWQSAARVLKPGGSVFLWTSGGVQAHPDMPAAAALNEAIDRNEDTILKPYMTAGNLLTRGRYRDLPLPWTTGVAGFSKDKFEMYDWPTSEPFHIGGGTANLDMFEKIKSSGSPVVRWRQANPELVGTEKDVVRMLRREIEAILHKAGVKPGEEVLKGSVYGVVIIVKKS